MRAMRPGASPPTSPMMAFQIILNPHTILPCVARSLAYSAG